MTGFPELEEKASQGCKLGFTYGRNAKIMVDETYLMNRLRILPPGSDSTTPGIYSDVLARR